MKKSDGFYPVLPAIAILFSLMCAAQAQSKSAAPHPIVLHAARMLDIKTGKIVKPGEILVQGEKIIEVGSAVKHPPDAEAIDLGDRTLMPGLVDSHVH
jgi:imidazolonepropionase-like amidohydrolase